MKKKLVVIFLGICLCLAGCGKYSESDIVKDLNKKIKKSSAYYVEGVMEIYNNEDKYTYSVNVSYKESNLYKVNLINNSNNHEQVILRNNNGVYV